MSDGPIGGARGSQEQKGRRRKKKRREGGERGMYRGDTFPKLKVVAYGSRMASEISERKLEETTIEIKAMATPGRSLSAVLAWGTYEVLKARNGCDQVCN